MKTSEVLQGQAGFNKIINGNFDLPPETPDWIKDLMELSWVDFLWNPMLIKKK